MRFLYLVLLLLIAQLPVVGIVPKPGIAIEQYERPARSMNNIGHLVSKGKKVSSCTATLIGTSGEIGIVLTAGHCTNLTSEEEVSKCRYQTVSFQPADTYIDPHQLPVIGRYVLNEYIDNQVDYLGDVGLVFVDMTDIVDPIIPRTINLNKRSINSSSIVQVAGYGKINSLDDLKNPKRRVMSTQATLIEKTGHTLWLLDEEAILSKATSVPIGDHPEHGDSGGPIIDVDTGAIIGVVSHREGNQFYSEPLYAHAEWLLAQIQHANNYFVFKPKKSGNFSEKNTWDGGKKPIKFKNAYGEINPIIVIDSQNKLSLDDNSSLYAINIVRRGGTLDVQSTVQHIEVLRANAPSIITSQQNSTLIADDVNIGHSDVSIQTKLQVLHKLRIQKGMLLNVQKEDTTRGLTIVDRGNLMIDGALEAHHIRFSSTTAESKSGLGCIYLSGTLKTTTPIQHSDHIIEGAASQPGNIDGDYFLSHKGLLSFNFDNSLPSSEPILNISGTANLQGGMISLGGSEALPVGYEKTLLAAKELKISAAWGGIYYSDIVPEDCKITFTHKDNFLKMKVVPASGSSDLSGILPLENWTR